MHAAMRGNRYYNILCEWYANNCQNVSVREEQPDRVNVTTAVTSYKFNARRNSHYFSRPTKIQSSC